VTALSLPATGVQVDVASSLDRDSSTFKSAAETCTRLIPAGLPYSKPPGS
jgi:hypothetical protein